MAKRFASGSLVLRRVFKTVREAAQKLMAWKFCVSCSRRDHWLMNTDAMGVYGIYYLKRTIVTQMGFGELLPSVPRVGDMLKFIKG